jgi:hypothetical protein
VILYSYKKEGRNKPRSLSIKIIPPLFAMIFSKETPTNPLLEDYEKFKKNGYWRKLCLNCKNHEIIVDYGHKTTLYFQCDYFNTIVMSVNLTSEKIASNCAGWSWIGKETSSKQKE